MKRFLIAAGLLVSAATPAMATPFVDISTYWRAYLPFGTPAGLASHARTAPHHLPRAANRVASTFSRSTKPSPRRAHCRRRRRLTWA
jgi:hypothetical protein